jgi:hypothetical protein
LSFWYDNWLEEGVLASLIPTVNIMDTEVHVKDVWQGDSWNFGSLATSIPDDDLKFRIIANPIPSSTYNIRGLSCLAKFCVSGEYKTQLAYSCL